MKKRKLLVSSTILDSWVSPDYLESPFSFKITLVKHTQCKTGISMFSLNLDGEPVITCDSFDFLKMLVVKDFELVHSILCDVLAFRKGYISSFESEE